MTLSSDSVPKNVIFTTNNDDPNKIVRIQLELVGFAITVSTNNGNQFTIVDQDDAQAILNQARAFNNSLSGGGDGDDDDEEEMAQNCTIDIEIKLDPVNSVNTFHIPA
jgi:hypothetical protein